MKPLFLLRFCGNGLVKAAIPVQLSIASLRKPGVGPASYGKTIAEKETVWREGLNEQAGNDHQQGKRVHTVYRPIMRSIAPTRIPNMEVDAESIPRRI